MARAGARRAGVEAACCGLENSSTVAAKASEESGGSEGKRGERQRRGRGEKTEEEEGGIWLHPNFGAGWRLRPMRLTCGPNTLFLKLNLLASNG